MEQLPAQGAKGVKVACSSIRLGQVRNKEEATDHIHSLGCPDACWERESPTARFLLLLNRLEGPAPEDGQGMDERGLPGPLTTVSAP